MNHLYDFNGYLNLKVLQKTFILYFLSAIALLSPLSANSGTINLVSSSPITGPTNIVAGYPSGQGSYASFTNPQDIALGDAVTVSGTIGGYPAIHNATNLTDGNYGNGSSWIDLGQNPWLTIKLGNNQSFDTLSFGRDRLGYFSDRNPGQFSIWVSNDNISFTQIFNSAILGFSGVLSAGQTVQANFSVVSAQYVKLQLTNSGAAIDEVEIENSISAVPEPAIIGLFSSSLVGLCFLRRKL